jgi:hypothetical protein
MLRLFCFLLYCLAVLAGVTGLLAGGMPLVEYTVKRLAGNDFDAYLILSASDRFSAEVIVMLSLMLLILVHIGHAVAGGLYFKESEKNVAVKGERERPPDSPPKEPGHPTLPAGPAQTAADIDKTDEKLAPLIKKGKG